MKKRKFGEQSQKTYQIDRYCFIFVYHNRPLIYKFPDVSLVPHYVNGYPFLHNTINFIKNYLNLKTNEAIIVLNHNLPPETIKPVCNYIKTQNISKVYFFTHDVFRIIHREFKHSSDSILIEKYPNEINSLDLDQIKFIIDSTKVNFEIFHCEHGVKIFEKRYDLKIKYFDTFVYENATNLFANRLTKLDYNFNYKLCCFNRRPEFHRTIISSLLYNEKDIFLTLNHRLSKEYFFSSDLLLGHSLEFKNRIIDNYNTILDNHISLSWDIDYTPDYFNELFVPKFKLNDPMKIIQESFLSLVTETRFYVPSQNISEKTTKPIAAGRPFIILGGPYTLKFLKNLGFKTFDQWWDESYDNIENHCLRLEKIYEVVNGILKKDQEELKYILEEMSQILFHNQQNLKNIGEKMFELNNL